MCALPAPHSVVGGAIAKRPPVRQPLVRLFEAGLGAGSGLRLTSQLRAPPQSGRVGDHAWLADAIASVIAPQHNAVPTTSPSAPGVMARLTELAVRLAALSLLEGVL